MSSFSDSDIVRELSFRRSRKDIHYFLNKTWHIQHPERGAIKFDLRPAQAETLDALLGNRRVIILKARQIGFSTLMAGYSFWLAWFQPDVQIVMLSRGEREAQDLLGKVKYGLKRLPEWMKERGPEIESETLSKIQLSNGSTIESLPSKSDPARGRTVTVVIVDEWAFLDNPEEAWASIEPIADIGGQVIGLSTANGSGTFFETMWNRAITGASDFKPVFFPWSAVTERGTDWYESKKRDLLPWQLAQEYPTSPEEAFIRSGNPVFDVDTLRLVPHATPKRGELRPVTATESEFVRQPNGALHVFEPPVPGVAYVIGADVAEGLEHGDWSVAWVLNNETGEAVAKWRGRIPPDVFGSTVLPRLAYWYNAALVGVEVNNHGYSTCVNLRDSGYPFVYYRHSYDQRRAQRQRKIGWRTSAATKPLMIDGLHQALREDLIVQDPETLAELMTYVREANGSTHGSPHDDQVMALAVAVQMRQHAVQPMQVSRGMRPTIDEMAEELMREQEPLRVGSRNIRNGTVLHSL